MNEFGTFLREQRKKRGWTQPDLSTRLGCDETCVSNWELGKNHPTTTKMHLLAKVLGVKVGTLFSYTSDQPLRGKKA